MREVHTLKDNSLETSTKYITLSKIKFHRMSRNSNSHLWQKYTSIFPLKKRLQPGPDPKSPSFVLRS